MTPPRFRPRLSALEAREVPAALLQVVNDSPYASAAAVDVYVNNLLQPELTNLAFRKASPFLTVPSAVPLVVSVRAAGASASTAPYLTQTFNLADGSTNQFVALGDPGQTGAAVTRFQLLAGATARSAAAASGKAEFVVVHGSPDAPPVDVKVRGVGTVVDTVSYPTYAKEGYLAVAPATYTLDVTLADGVSRVGSYRADLSGAAGKAVTVLASGFIGTLPAGTAVVNTFGLLLVNSDGTTALLTPVSPPVLATSFAAGAANYTAGVFNFAGQTVTAPAAGGSASAIGRTQERVVLADIDGDGVLDTVYGSGPGATTSVSVAYGGSATTVRPLVTFSPFEASFTGGVFVTAADLNGDGKAEIIVTPDQGGGPVVAIYDGAKLAAAGATNNGADAQLTRFFGIDDPNFRGGARAAVGNLNNAGRPDLIVAAGFGGGPRVAVFNGDTVLTPTASGQLPPKLLPDFFVFESTLRNGVYVTAGDVNGDGYDDLLVGGGPGGGPRVFGLSGKELTAAVSGQVAVANFFAGDPNNRDGVRLAAKDLDGDGLADLVVGLGSAGVPQVRGFRGKDFVASVTGTTPTAVAALDLNPFTNPGSVYVG